MPDREHEIGELQGRLGAVERLVDEQRSDIKCILKILNEARGGWRTLILVASMAGVVGALATKFAAFFASFR